MGNDWITTIIEAAQNMVEHGHPFPLVAVVNPDNYNDVGADGVTTEWGEVRVIQNARVEPGAMHIMEERDYNNRYGSDAL